MPYALEKKFQVEYVYMYAGMYVYVGITFMTDVLGNIYPSIEQLQFSSEYFYGH